MNELTYIKGNAKGSFKLKLSSSSTHKDVYHVDDLYLCCDGIVEDATLGSPISSLPDRTEFDRYEVPPCIRKRDIVADMNYGGSVYEVKLHEVILHHVEETGTFHDPEQETKVVTYEALFVAIIHDWKPTVQTQNENQDASINTIMVVPVEPNNLYGYEGKKETRTVKADSSNTAGCLSSSIWFIALLLFSSLMLAGFGSSAAVGIFILIMVAALMYHIRSFLWMLMKLVFGIALLVWSLALIKDLVDTSNESGNRDDGTTNVIKDNIDEPSLLEDDVDGTLLSRVHSWTDYSQNRYNGQFKVSLNDYERSSTKRRSFTPSTGGVGMYSELYGAIVNYPESEMRMVQEMYTALVVEGTMPRSAFAEMVVSSIQNIPYFLVHEFDCIQSSASNNVSADFHRENGSEYCLPNVAFGLTTPSEFVRTFKGDCDTRALYLYNVLDRLGFDVAILVSVEYGHAVLGINLPYEGKRLRSHTGKSYSVWETTAPDWKPGQLDPSVSDMRLWKIAIQSQP